MGQELTCLTVDKYSNGSISSQKDFVAVEHRLTIYLDDQLVSEILCSPKKLKELAIGHLISLEVIGLRSQPKTTLRSNQEGTSAYIQLEPAPRKVEPIIVPDAFDPVPPSLLLSNMSSLVETSNIFAKSGAAHCSAFFRDRTPILIHDDIARHNTIDRIIGDAVVRNISLDNGMLCTTGRLSHEIIRRCEIARIPLVISRGAPTNAAVKLAHSGDITIVGFARNERFNIYTHSQRIAI